MMILMVQQTHIQLLMLILWLVLFAAQLKFKLLHAISVVIGLKFTHHLAFPLLIYLSLCLLLMSLEVDKHQDQYL